MLAGSQESPAFAMAKSMMQQFQRKTLLLLVLVEIGWYFMVSIVVVYV
jgi:hypothetical protein